MQCCESLDESRSWVHQSLRDEIRLRQAPEVPTFGTGVLRSPFIPHSKLYDSRLDKYNTLLTLYKYRSLTEQNDAIHAFSGILQALEQSEYGEGFFWRLPIADLNWALLWDARAWHLLEPRTGFPTWCWASWRGPIWPGKPQAKQQGDPANTPRQYPVDLRMWRTRKGDVEMIYEMVYHDIEAKELWKLPHDPLSKELELKNTNCLRTLANHPDSESHRLLCIESVMFHFSPDLSEPEDEEFDGDGNKFFVMYVRDVPLVLHIIDTNELLSTSYHGEKRTFLLLARNVHRRWIKHFLLLLRPAGDLFERCGVVSLEVQQTRLEVLRELGMTKTRVLIA